MTLNTLGKKKTAKIIEIKGGQGIKHRLEALGIRKGSLILKTGAHFWKGPITVTVGKTKAAIGYGMADKIIVEEQDG